MATEHTAQVALGDRDFTVLRNQNSQQWALHAFPEPDMPYAETIFFSPFSPEQERMLLEMSPTTLLRFFMQHLGELDIADIDVRGDAKDLDRVTPWSYRLRSVVRGWVRFGNQCGLD